MIISYNKYLDKNMKNSKFVLDKLSKIFEQGLITSKDLGSEILNILKSKRDELIFKLKITSSEETEILERRIEKLEQKLEKIEKIKKVKKTKRAKK